MRQDLYDRIVDYIVENQDKFYRLAYSYVHNKEDALDIVQSAVLKALDHYQALRDENAVRTWFYRILVNESIGLIKQRKRETLTEDGMDEDVPYYETGFCTRRKDEDDGNKKRKDPDSFPRKSEENFIQQAVFGQSDRAGDPDLVFYLWPHVHRI